MKLLDSKPRLLQAVWVALLLLAAQAGCERGYRGVYFRGEADLLWQIHAEWDKRGRPDDFDIPAEYRLGAGMGFFVFTNQVTVSNKVYHCRFGARQNYWPPGTLAVTDEGVVLWIRSRGGSIIVSPEREDVDP